MSHYEVIPSRRWKNSKTGATASIYGSVPFITTEERAFWSIVDVGWTVRNLANGRVGVGKSPWATKEEAEAWVAADTERRARIAAQHKEIYG